MSSTKIAEAKGIAFLLFIITLLAVVMMATTGKLEEWFGIRLYRLPDVAGKIAFVSDRNGHNDIWIMNRDGSGQKALTNDKYDDNSPVWSPDGTEIVFVSDRDQGRYQLYAVSYDGKRIRKLSLSSGTKSCQVFNPDGKEIAFLNSGKVSVRDVDGRHEHPVLPSEEQSQIAANDDKKMAFVEVDWSATGKVIAAVNRIEPAEAITLLNMESGESGVPKDDKDQPLVGVQLDLAWSRNGERLAVASTGGPNGNNLAVLDMDRETYYTLLQSSDPRRTLIQPDWSPDDEYVAVVGAVVKGPTDTVPESLIVVEASEGSSMFGIDQGHCEHPKWSHDGKNVTYTRTAGGKKDIYIADVESKKLKNLTNGKGSNFDACWAPGPAKK